MNLSAQEWKTYPYNPENSIISFPKDEGLHTNEKTEWWYTFAKLKGKETGNDYTVMFTFFYRDTLFFDGLRIFNISNETTKEFFHDAKPVNYNTNSVDYLNIEAKIYGQNRVETWKTKADSNGILIPFNYKLKAKAAFGAINLDYNVIKRPLILADSGFLYQGSKNYTYYYSFTEIEVNGELTLNGITEPVEGIAWFDKQYGNFHPEVEEKYEWLSLKLSNGIDINTWEIFNKDFQVPQTPDYKQFNCYIDDNTSLNTYDFKIERLDYFYSPDSARVYCKKFLLTEPKLDLNLEVEISNPNCEPSYPFNFYEGPLKIKGKVGDENITGFGFGELLHTYNKQAIEFKYPNTKWNRDSLIKWSISNPDFGRPVTYDLYSRTFNTKYILIDSTLTDTSYTVAPSDFSQDSLYQFLLISSSPGNFFKDSISTEFYMPISVFEENNSDIKVFPTIFSNSIIVERESTIPSENTNIVIVSDINRIILKKRLKMNSSRMKLYFNNLPDGLYVIYVSDRGIVYSKKIIHVSN